MIDYVEGNVYKISEGASSFEVVCHKVFSNGSVSLFRYKKAGAKTPSARYRVDPKGNVVDHPDAIVIEAKNPVGKRNAIPTRDGNKSIEKHAALKKIVCKAWKEGKPAGYYAGLAKVSTTCYHELMYLYYLRRTQESMA